MVLVQSPFDGTRGNLECFTARGHLNRLEID